MASKSGFVIDKIASDIAQEFAQESTADPSKSLLPPSAQKDRLKGEIVQVLDTHFASVSNGIDYLLERTAQLIQSKDPKVDSTIFVDVLNKLSEEKTVQLTTEELKLLSVAAVDMYNQEEYDHAADAFYVLTIFAPERSVLWKSLGNAKYFGKHYNDAFNAYAMALNINENDPECLLFQARCLQNEGHQQDAIAIIQQAADIVAKDLQFAAWNETVTALLHDLKQK